ncbi:hypothetical protein FOZ63_004898, partial [Perkinsus olseni]
KELLALLKGKPTSWDEASSSTVGSSEPSASPGLDRLFGRSNGTESFSPPQTTDDEKPYKRYLCWYWQNGYRCVHGDHCRFAHGFGDMGHGSEGEANEDALVTIHGSEFPPKTLIKFPLLGCDIRYQSGLFSLEESELFLSMLMSEKHVSWNTVGYGRDVVQFSSPKGMKYSFSESEYTADAFPPFVLGIMHRVKSVLEPVYGRDKVQFNYCVANVYRSGRAGVTYHSDNEPELRSDCPIACVSFGAERIFSLKRMRARQEVVEEGKPDKQPERVAEAKNEKGLPTDKGGDARGKGKGKKGAEGRKEESTPTTPGKGKGGGRAGKGKGKGRMGDHDDEENSKARKGKGGSEGGKSKSSTPEKGKEIDEKGPPGSSRKVVVRLLPPTITEEQLWKSIPETVKGSVVWRYFVPGVQPKRPSITSPAVNSRCYLEFDSKQRAADFVNSFHGHKFVDHLGETYRAVVCAAPWGRCMPGGSSRRPRHSRDVKEGSIDRCKYFKDFIASIAEEAPAALPEPLEGNGWRNLRLKLVRFKKASVTCDPAKTPLVDYINDWYKEKEKRREKERRRQREAAEEARKKKKHAAKEAKKAGEKKGAVEPQEGKKKSNRSGRSSKDDGNFRAGTDTGEVAEEDGDLLAGETVERFPHEAELVRRCSEVGVKMVVACSTGPEDWDDTAGLDSSLYKPQVGIHPWYVTEEMAEVEAGTSWMPKMRRLLEANPSFGVGEIGIDKIRAREVPMEIQMKVFKRQLELAAELGRPVSLHCVRAYGQLLDTLKEVDERIPAIVLHAYGGSAELVKDFLRCTQKRVYFSVSARSPSPKHLPGVLKAVPRDRLLIETDSPDQMPLDVERARL